MGLLDRNRPNPSSQGAQSPFSNTPLAGGPVQAMEPERLRELLAAAIEAKDGPRLGQLATAHRDVITRNFPDWQRVPIVMRDDQPAMQKYANFLIILGQFFRDVFNDPSLLKLLTGDDANNPLAQWQNKLRQADAYVNEFRFDEARALLEKARQDIETLQTSGPVSYLAVTEGKLAHCYFHAGDALTARPYAERALALSEEKGDEQGTAAALRELYDLHRYLGNWDLAAGYAERIAGHALKNGHPAESQRWVKQAQLVRAGEPLCRMTFWVNDAHYEADSLPTLTNAKVRYGFMRNRQPIGICQGLVLRGAQLAHAGRFEEALADFRAAAKADPFDPQPHYQRAAALMNLDRAGDAVQAYEATEALAPGWFYCRADRWLAVEVAEGREDMAVFRVLRTEDLPEEAMPLAQKAATVEEALSRARSGLPLLNLYHGKCLARLGKAAEAEAAFRAGLESVQDPDTRSRLLVELQNVIADEGEKARILREAAAVPGGNLIAGAIATLALKELSERAAPATA
jgi:tetratricopeptide (TPR) repeat protein